ncbi:unnamed protein product [Nezara viridula]|uniref:Uncharacterized protein n=1 Tax=Nezara viridula TaxID=85310 RepID=A0A9P0HLX2_NEZVI|nr:unnamed protein product [Nezara viridula]
MTQEAGMSYNLCDRCPWPPKSGRDRGDAKGISGGSIALSVFPLLAIIPLKISHYRPPKIMAAILLSAVDVRFGITMSDFLKLR